MSSVSTDKDKICAKISDVVFSEVVIFTWRTFLEYMPTLFRIQADVF